MKFFIIFILGLAFAHAEEFLPEKLKAVSYKEIDKFEKELLSYFKKLTPKEKQEKYLLAGRYFSQVGEFEKAFYILEKGVTLEKPHTEYLVEFFSLMDHLQKKAQIEKYFTSVIRAGNFRNQGPDELCEVILIYLKSTQVLSQSLKEDFLKEGIKKSSSAFRIKWMDSITLAKQGEFKKSFDMLKDLKPLGEEESIYVSYLQKKNNLLPKFCTKVQSFPELSERTSYKKSCLILLNENQNLEEKLKDTNEIMEHTPLYEVLY